MTEVRGCFHSWWFLFTVIQFEASQQNISDSRAGKSTGIFTPDKPNKPGGKRGRGAAGGGQSSEWNKASRMGGNVSQIVTRDTVSGKRKVAQMKLHCVVSKTNISKCDQIKPKLCAWTSLGKWKKLCFFLHFYIPDTQAANSLPFYGKYLQELTVWTKKISLGLNKQYITCWSSSGLVVADSLLYPDFMLSKANYILTLEWYLSCHVNTVIWMCTFSFYTSVVNVHWTINR